MKRTVIIGFGNLLMGDDGLGIHVVREMGAFTLPPGVELLDGGVASLEVLGSVLDASKIVIVDALTGGGEPGAIYRLTPADLGSPAAPPGYSLHDFSLVQALALLGHTAKLPPIVIYGVEPAGFEMGLELSSPVAAAAKRVTKLILEEVRGNADA